MPTFDYRCRTCGAIMEGDSLKAELLVCQNCGGRDFERQFSPPNLVHADGRQSGHTCCGRTERCDKPPCSSGGGCRRD